MYRTVKIPVSEYHRMNITVLNHSNQEIEDPLHPKVRPVSSPFLPYPPFSEVITVPTLLCINVLSFFMNFQIIQYVS